MDIYKHQRKGFTLIELLTAVAITVIIIGVLIGMTRVSMDSFKESSDKAKASRLAKESIEIMARDLEGLVIRSGNDYEWFRAEIDSTEIDGPNGAELKNPLDLVFFTAATDRYDGKIGDPVDDKGGDISAVHYRLVYEEQLTGGFPVYSLYRELINPDDAFDDYLAQSSLPSSNNVIQNDNFLAQNVYNMTMTLIFEYQESGTTRQKRVPIMDSGSDYDEISILGNSIDTSPALQNDNNDDISGSARLSGVELGMLVINESGMNTLRNKNFPSPEDFNAFLKKNSHYFTKSVVLPRP